MSTSTSRIIFELKYILYIATVIINTKFEF